MPKRQERRVTDKEMLDWLGDPNGCGSSYEVWPQLSKGGGVWAWKIGAHDFGPKGRWFKGKLGLRRAIAVAIKSERAGRKKP